MSAAPRGDCPNSDTGGHYFEKHDGARVCTLEPPVTYYECCRCCLHDEDEPEPYVHLDPCEEGCNDEPEGGAA